MKTRFKIPQWLQGEDNPGQDEFSQINSFYKDYANEGDEFLDDGRRMTEQEFDQSNN